jgi:hypothetical protein
MNLVRQVLYPAEEDDARLWKAEIFDERLEEAGVDVSALSSWPVVDELRLVANVAKHGDGRSAHDLYGRRPDLFVAPELRGMRGPINPGAGTRSPRVRTPILGCDLYVTEDDVRSYAAAVATFWRELAAVMLAAR